MRINRKREWELNIHGKVDGREKIYKNIKFDSKVNKIVQKKILFILAFYYLSTHVKHVYLIGILFNPVW